MLQQAQQYIRFQSFYSDYQDKVMSFMMYRINNRALAEDLTSDTFIKAYEKFDSYDDQYAFSTWIYAIARNTLIDFVRKNKEYVGIEEYEEQEDEQFGEEVSNNNLDTELNMERVKEMIHKLPDLQRESILMKYLEELNTKEIAAELGESEANIRQALSRGLKKIKQKAIVLSAIILLLLLF